MEKKHMSFPVSPEAADKIAKVRNAFAILDTTIAGLAPASRELSIALTNTEQAAMWAIKAISHNEKPADD